jgi:capsular polysaccharide transport system permease protein
MATSNSSTLPSVSAAGDIWRGAAMNLRVVIALIFREAAMRFGSNPFSYVWTLVEPAIMVAILLVARVYIKNVNPAFGESSMLFLLTGIVALRAARNIINRGGKGITVNKALFEFGAVKPLDAVLARTVLEFTIWLIILTCFFTAVARIIGQEVITNFTGLVISLLQILYFCIAMSFFNATVGALVPIWRSIWKMMSMPLLITSGILYVPASMPPEILNIIIWNPFLHCVEALRSSSYLDYLSVYDPYYLLGFSTVVLLLSMSIERLFRKEILKSKGDEDEEDEI